MEHTLVGVLHGSSLATCVPGNHQKVPGIFANLQHQDNLDFIEKWLPLGEYFPSPDSDTNVTARLFGTKYDYFWNLRHLRSIPLDSTHH